MKDLYVTREQATNALNKLVNTDFRTALYGLELGQRIDSGDKDKYQFEWHITRVPSGWVYSCPAGQGHSVFVPYHNEPEF